MPVFHTKTIESILEPVAQQVNCSVVNVWAFFPVVVSMLQVNIEESVRYISSLNACTLFFVLLIRVRQFCL